jgi:four helix bundle protein
MKESFIYNKAVDFAVRIVNLYKYLTEIKKETIMSKQLLRSGTSIGANISEALSAESTADFIHKLSIYQKELNETQYWLTLLQKTEYISEKQYESIQQDCEDIRKMLISIIITSKKNS